MLIVDDDAGFRSFVSGLVEEAGFDALEAENGEDALRLATAEPPAAVLLDVALPGLSGYEVCQRLREQFGDTLPIIFVSGKRTREYDRAGGMLLGADDYIVKPFDPGEFIARVRRHVGRARSARDDVHLTPREHEVLARLFVHSAVAVGDRDLELVLGPVGERALGRPVGRGDQGGMGIAQDHRAPRRRVVDVPVAVGVLEARADPAREVEGDGGRPANGARDPSGQGPAGALEEGS